MCVLTHGGGATWLSRRNTNGASAPLGSRAVVGQAAPNLRQQSAITHGAADAVSASLAGVALSASTLVTWEELTKVSMYEVSLLIHSLRVLLAAAPLRPDTTS